MKIRKRTISSPPAPAARQLSMFGTKLLVLVCLVLVLLAFPRLHFDTTIRSLICIYYQLSSRVFGDDPFKGTPKIAFLFLARRNLPLDFLWGTFFKNVDRARFSIYVHSQPGFVFNESNTRSGFFYGRQSTNSIQVVWGESSMIEAERLLFEVSLDDPANQRFVLLSDSCIPLYNFSYIYNYLMSSPKSFVNRFQWITLIRRHAVIVVNDDIVFSVFRKLCKRRPPADLIKGRQMLHVSQLPRSCLRIFRMAITVYLLNTTSRHCSIWAGLKMSFEPRTLTSSLWNQSAEGEEMSSWHPFWFDFADATPQVIQEKKEINHVDYEYEDQKELCHVNITTAPCFVFARKFTAKAAMRPLTEPSIDIR